MKEVFIVNKEGIIGVFSTEINAHLFIMKHHPTAMYDDEKDLYSDLSGDITISKEYVDVEKVELF